MSWWKHNARVPTTRLSSLLVYLFLVSPFAFSFEVTQPASSSGAPQRNLTGPQGAALFQQLQGLEKTFGEVAAVTAQQTAAAASSLPSTGATAAAASEKSPSPSSGSESKEASATKADLGATKPSVKNERVGEMKEPDPDASAKDVASINKPSTSTLNLSDLGNFKSVMGTLGDLSRRKMDKSMPTLSGLVAQAQARNKPVAPSEKKNKDKQSSPLSQDTQTPKTTFGDAGEPTFSTIASNRRDTKPANRSKNSDKPDKDSGKDDKNKEKDKKKEEERKQLEKKLEDLLQKDPFKFEDYAKLRDLFSESGPQAGSLLENNPSFSKIRDRILNEFVKQDASPAFKKDPLVNFLNEASTQEPFQNPIAEDPSLPIHREGLSH